MVPIALVIVVELLLLHEVHLGGTAPILVGHRLPGLDDARTGLALRHVAIAGEVAARPVAVKLPVGKANPAELVKTLRKSKKEWGPSHP